MPLRDVAVLLDVRSAALEVRAEWKFETHGAEEALRTVEESRDFALNEGLVSAVRHLSALRVMYLIADERIDQAARAWRGAGLPEDLPNLLDLDAQSWREMEAISCARIRLLAAQGEFEAAREVAAGLCEVARKRGLARTRMRCLALWMGLEYRAGRENDAAARLLEYLRALGGTDYIKPLVRERETSCQVMRALLGLGLQANIREIANAALEQLGTTVADVPAGATLHRARNRGPGTSGAGRAGQGDRPASRHYGKWRALSSEEHLPEAECHRQGRCGAAGTFGGRDSSSYY